MNTNEKKNHEKKDTIELLRVKKEGEGEKSYGIQKKTLAKAVIVIVVIAVILAVVSAVKKSSGKKEVVQTMLSVQNEVDLNSAFGSQLNECRGSESFEQDLVKGMAEAAETAAENTDINYGFDGADGEPKADAFGNQVDLSLLMRYLSTRTNELNRLDYDEPAYSHAVEKAAEVYREYAFSKAPKDKEDGEKVLQYALVLNDFYASVWNYNDNVREPYRIDLDRIIDPQYINGVYGTAIRLLEEQGNYDLLAGALHAAAHSVVSDSTVYLPAEDILQLYLGEETSYGVLFPKEGAYYEDEEHLNELKEQLKKEGKKFSLSCVYGDLYYDDREQEDPEKGEKGENRKFGEGFPALTKRDTENITAYYKGQKEFNGIKIKEVDFAKMKVGEKEERYLVFGKEGEAVVVGRSELYVPVKNGTQEICLPYEERNVVFDRVEKAYSDPANREPKKEAEQSEEAPAETAGKKKED